MHLSFQVKELQVSGVCSLLLFPMDLHILLILTELMVSLDPSKIVEIIDGILSLSFKHLLLFLCVCEIISEKSEFVMACIPNGSSFG